jgi:peptidoglycan/xylan/chitin deacetylase (PgdA/CDA1 family)
LPEGGVGARASALAAGDVFCPPGASFDPALGFCADATNAYGPFPRAMVRECRAQGAGDSCEAKVAFVVQGRSVDAPRWGRAFAASLRGDGPCPAGTSPDGATGACAEAAADSASGVREAYGPFPNVLVALCLRDGGGDTCFTSRWAYEWYARLAATYPTPSAPNFGAPAVLEYHAVVPGAGIALDPGSFVSAGHVARLARTFSPLRHLVTFDDGYRSVYDLALPALAAAGVPAVIGVITRAVRDGGDAGARPEYLSRQEVYALGLAGWDVAFHAGSIAEHELDYRRYAEALETGFLPAGAAASGSVDLAGPDALAALTALLGDGAPDAPRLLERVRAERAQVERAVADGATAGDAAARTLAVRLGGERLALAELAGVPVEQIATFVYPHSESNETLRRAAAAAGFRRAYAGGELGRPDDPFDLPRRWMNDATPIP